MVPPLKSRSDHNAPISWVAENPFGPQSVKSSNKTPESVELVNGSAAELVGTNISTTKNWISSLNSSS